MKHLIALLLVALTVSSSKAQCRRPTENEIRKCCLILNIGRRNFDRYREDPQVIALLNQLIQQNQQLMALLARREQDNPRTPIIITIPGIHGPGQILPQTPPQQRLPQRPPQQVLPQQPPQQVLPQSPPQQSLPQQRPQQSLPLGPPAGYQEFTRAIYPTR